MQTGLRSVRSCGGFTLTLTPACSNAVLQAAELRERVSGRGIHSNCDCLHVPVEGRKICQCGNDSTVSILQMEPLVLPWQSTIFFNAFIFKLCHRRTGETSCLHAVTSPPCSRAFRHAPSARIHHRRMFRLVAWRPDVRVAFQ